MAPSTFSDMELKNIKVNKSNAYNGHTIKFTVKGQDFLFMTGNSKVPFPMSVKHEFIDKDICKQCGKRIYPAGISIQLCGFFQQKQQDLLQYILRTHPEEFQN